jgi:AcrR family transcriptional regulator
MEVLTSNKKCAAILQSAQRLFRKHGFRRVTIDEICREAKTSKMTFYRFFPDKIELAKSVLDQYYEENFVKFRKIIMENTSAAEKMQQMIKIKFDGSNDISNEFIQDFLMSSNPELTAYFQEKTKTVLREGIKGFKQGQEEGWIRKDLNVEFLFHFSQKIVPMIYDNDLMNLFKTPQELIMEVTNLIIYGISPKEKQ